MHSKLRPSPAMVVALIALFVALGGTAAALQGSNTVQSDDLGPGAQVKAADIAANAVAAPPWRQVGGAGQPAFHQTTDCKWRNYDQVHSTAAFVRDATGFVHLKGTVLAEDRTSASSCGVTTTAPTNQLIFVLPPGYRPSSREAMAVLTANDLTSGPATVGTAAVDGPAISPLPAGGVSVDRGELGEFAWFTLNGISFRCAPSGSNGCP
jgi:hypothetical protein